MNRRFVAYYFNRSGKGRGGNAVASRFTKDKPGNPYAYLAAYLPDGTYVSETEVYADKHAVFQWLRDLLEAHPKLSAWTPAEKLLLSEAQSGKALSVARAARLLEELGERAHALRLYASPLLRGRRPLEEAERGTWRILRSQQDWDGLQRALDAKANPKQGGIPEGLVTDWLAEQGYVLLAKGKYEAAQELLQARIRAHDLHPRAAELHFSLGRADWFLKERDWARFHWMWIWQERPQNRLAMRAKIAAAALIMPYPNPELGGFRASGSIGPQDVEAEHGRSCALYRKLAPFYARGDWTGPAREDARLAGSDTPYALVRQLRDGNRHAAANNKLVEKLVALGEPALEPLAAAIADRAFLGRGYAGWALGKVIQATGKSPPAVRRALVIGLQDADGYVSGLTRSGLGQAGLAWADLQGAVQALEEEESEKRRAAGESVPWEGNDPAILAGRLLDGNEHRVVNNRIVDRLVALGAVSVEPLMERLRDGSFGGRGYAAWALACVLEPLPTRPEGAVRLLRETAETETGYVRALAQSGLGKLE